MNGFLNFQTKPSLFIFQTKFATSKCWQSRWHIVWQQKVKEISRQKDRQIVECFQVCFSILLTFFGQLSYKCKKEKRGYKISWEFLLFYFNWVSNYSSVSLFKHFNMCFRFNVEDMNGITDNSMGIIPNTMNVILVDENFDLVSAKQKTEELHRSAGYSFSSFAIIIGLLIVGVLVFLFFKMKRAHSLFATN